VFKVVGATFKPLAFPGDIRAARTSLSDDAVVKRAQSMKWQRCGMARPGVSTSTMNAVICLRSAPYRSRS